MDTFKVTPKLRTFHLTAVAPHDAIHGILYVVPGDTKCRVRYTEMTLSHQDIVDDLVFYKFPKIKGWAIGVSIVFILLLVPLYSFCRHEFLRIDSTINKLINIDVSNHGVHLGYRPDIDGLRAIAITVVVLFHAFPNFISGGFVGVDVFFVISGYLISSIIFKSLSQGFFSFKDFYTRRIFRIFPALILVLASCLLFGWFALLPDEYKQLGEHAIGGFGFIQNFLLWNEVGYFDNAADLKPLRHLWSLGIEEQYYLLYPLLVYALWHRSYVFTIIVLIAVVSFALNIIRIENHTIEVFFLPHTRIWELLAGGALAYLQLFKQHDALVSSEIRAKDNGWHLSWLRAFTTLDYSSAIKNNVFASTGLVLIIGSCFFLNKSSMFPGWWALAPVVGSWLIISAGSKGWVNRWVLSNRILVFVGLISYPLYLWHWPLLSFAQIIESGTASFFIRLWAVVASCILALSTYAWLEKPLRLWTNIRLKMASLCALAIIFTLIA